MIGPAAMPIAAASPSARRPRLVLLRHAVPRLLLTIVPVFLISTFLIFSLGVISGSNPGAVRLGEYATPAAVRQLNHQFGVDRPFLVRYGSWLADFVRGDFGRSWTQDLPVGTSITNRLPVDLWLAVFALALAIVLGLSAGLAAGVTAGSWLDRTITAFTSFILSIPEFVIGVSLIVLFSVKWRLLPPTGYVSPTADAADWLRHIVLPAVALSLWSAAHIAQQLRVSLIGVLQENFVLGAVVRGFSRKRILFKHVLRNAAGPAVTMLGLDLPRILGGAVVIETVFALPGLGQYALNASLLRDFPAVQGVLAVTIIAVLLANFAVNAVLEWLRPEAKL